MRSRQTGITLIGWIILLAPLALCFYAGVRLTPVYLNYLKVARTLEGIKTDFKDSDSSTLNVNLIRATAEKHLDINSVDYPTKNDFKITRDGKAWLVEAAYDDQAPLFQNVFILVSFDKSVTLGGSGAGY